MMKMYEGVLSKEKAKEFVDQIFNKFDSDNSGEIDFKVCCNLNLSHRAQFNIEMWVLCPLYMQFFQPVSISIRNKVLNKLVRQKVVVYAQR